MNEASVQRLRSESKGQRVVIVGSMALDTVEAPGGVARDVLGGAVTYAALTCSFFAQASPVCVVGEDFPQEHISLLASHGVDTRGIQRQEGKTFRWRARYLEDSDERETLETHCNVFDDFWPILSEEQRQGKYVLLGNIQPTLQLSVLEQMKSPKIVSCDTMDLWINTQREEMEQVVRRCHIFLLNEWEARLLCSTGELRSLGEQLLGMGPECVIIKMGRHGAFVAERNGLFWAPAYPVKRVVDPTGAGDAFAGAVMGYLAREGNMDPDSLRRAVALGAVMASFVVEDFSVQRLVHLTKEEIQSRYLSLTEMTRFGDIRL